MVGAALIFVVVRTRLLLGKGSAVALVMIARLVTAPAVGQLTRMLAMTLAPLAMEPRLKVSTLPLRLLVPWVEIAERKVTLEGRVLVRLTLEAATGPALVAMIV